VANVQLNYEDAAFLVGGRWRAVVAALAALHVRGLVDASAHGEVAKTQKVTGIPAGGLEYAAWSTLAGSVSPSGLAARLRLDVALTELRRSLRLRRLLRPLIPVTPWSPARSMRATRLLGQARSLHPLPVISGPAPDPEGVGWVVALHGEDGLLAVVPRFATGGGLLTRWASDDMTHADAGAVGPSGRYY
jgi:hypothetical protein